MPKNKFENQKSPTDQLKRPEPPALGERRARWGYGYQDKVATERILEILRSEFNSGTLSFEGVRLADLEAGRVDDFVLVWKTEVQGNSIKWSAAPDPINWAELIGVNGLLKELAQGHVRLSNKWPGRRVTVRLQTNRPPAIQRHPAQLISNLSVEEFVNNYWVKGPTAAHTAQVAAVWEKIAEHVRLQGDELSQFVRQCELVFSFPQPPLALPDSLDFRSYQNQFADLHKAIATWITDYPEKDFVDRQFLLAAIGLHGYRPGLVQRFPQPQIPYERNHISGHRLKQLIDSTSGGYLVVTGSAGVGKSTLVQDVLSAYPFFVPYYAYLPDGQGNPRDRGEALVFFQDVTLRLDRFLEHKLSLGVTDVAQGRETLRDQMKKSHDIFIANGRKTILLIDGLDHVAREIGLDRSMLQELPLPAEIPDGFLIILSSQPQALLPGSIERHVAATIETHRDRRIEVTGLERSEVHEIVRKAEKETSGEERDAIFNASQGNPLILTYLLKALERDATLTVEATIATIGDFSGDIDEYYRSSLSIPLQGVETRHALALLSRAAPTIPVSWLQIWPERLEIENLYQFALAPFIRSEDGHLYFIHNSLIAFLKDETRSILPGADLEQDERNYHSDLADRCGNASCANPLGRAKIFHLLRSSRDRDLLTLLSSDWIRTGLEAFVPHLELRHLLLAGLASAWRLEDYGEVLRLILLDYETDQRTSRITPDSLARKLLELDLEVTAISQIRSAGRILVEDMAALRFAKDLWVYATQRKRDELKKLARIIYLQSKPIAYIYQEGKIDPVRSHNISELLREWAGVAPLFDGIDEVVTQINGLQFERPMRHGDASGSAVKSNLLYVSLGTTLRYGASEDCIPLIGAMTKLRQPTFLFAGLLLLAFSNSSAKLLKRLHGLYQKLTPNSDLTLRFAELLYQSGRLGESSAIISKLHHIRCDEFQNQYNLGFTDISFTVSLAYLQAVLGLEQGVIPHVKEHNEEAAGRIETAARELGVLFATIRSGKSIQNLRDVFRSLLLFHNRTIVFPDLDWSGKYLLSRSKSEIYTNVIELANRVGIGGLEELRDAFLELVQGPAGPQFSAQHRRMFAAFLYRADILDRQAALSLGLSDIADAEDEDPTQRQEACLEIAAFLHKIGAQDPIQEWIARASKASAGAGSHKDYHMAQLSEWLAVSIGTSLDESKLRVVDQFFRALQVAGGAGTSSAATHLVESLFGVEPIRLASLAIELIDREILNVSETLEALLLGGATSGASASLLKAIYSEFLLLSHTGNTSKVAVAVLRLYPQKDRISVARSLMQAVRTNALPSRRIEIGRSIQDALREDGLPEEVLTSNLGKSADDSARHGSLYKLSNGELLTLDHVASRLSSPDQQDQWNPNPSENADFEWWAAILRTSIRDTNHLNKLLNAFPPPDYRMVEMLAWRAEWLMKLGNRQGAKEAVQEAIKQSTRSSWFSGWDGAQKRRLYSVMKALDLSNALIVARKEFGAELCNGKLYNHFLLDEIIEVFAFLELKWPNIPVLQLLADYLDGVLAANRKSLTFSSTTESLISGSPDEALCRFILKFLSFPVVDIGVAARRALVRYATEDGSGLVQLLTGPVFWDSVQLEHLLLAIQIGLKAETGILRTLKQYVQRLNQHESIAVRAIARRICSEQEWDWHEIRNLPSTVPSIILHEREDLNFEEARMLIGNDSSAAFKLYRRISSRLEAFGRDPLEVRSNFFYIFREVEKEYLWRDEKKFQRWMKLIFAKFWLNPRAIIGREAAMRLLGIDALSGQVPQGAESAYDFLYPIYDPIIELLNPIERPSEFRIMDWDSFGEEHKRWLDGENATQWRDYPKVVGQLQLIGERTLFIRPDWEWPREERYRGILSGAAWENDLTRDVLASYRELTYELYLQGVGQDENQLIVRNAEHQLIGPEYRWIAINSNFAKSLGWRPSETNPFEWLDSSGALMVRSVFWRNGWIGLNPPHFEALGEGWLVLATAKGFDHIRRERPGAKCHLWVERHSHGNKPYKGDWHLISDLTGDAFS